MSSPPRVRPEAQSAQLGLGDVTASTVANIGPGIDFYFAFGVIAVTAGVGAPVTIITAGVAVGLLAFVAAEFTRMEPSAGSFITYVETSLGARAGAVTSLLIALGFTIAIAGVFAMSGGMISLTLDHYTSWHPSWLPIAVVVTGAGVAIALRGAGSSTALVAGALVFQVVTMVVICVVVLAKQSDHLTTVPLRWSSVSGGLSGLAAGFPLALFMFVGWENGPALAEETREPKLTIPRALYISIAAATALFVLFAYTTIVGFHYETSSIGRASVPFLEMADRYLGSAAILAWLAGIFSVLSTLVAAANSQARVLSDGGRSGLLWSRLGTSRPPGETPAFALRAMTAVGLGIVAVWWLCHATGLIGGSSDPVNLYAECSTMGTILILFVYVLTAVSLPVFIRRRGRRLSPVRHCLMPLLGVLVLVIPFAELFAPGQPFPYSVFPYASVAILLAAFGYARYVLAHNPRAGAMEGSAG
ncbi:MAG TPA: APC family permease [Solirubrobacteraceae bacterium]|nr:APC family permease [Solirubrobacteraceae bacterium]